MQRRWESWSKCLFVDRRLFVRRNRAQAASRRRADKLNSVSICALTRRKRVESSPRSRPASAESSAPALCDGNLAELRPRPFRRGRLEGGFCPAELGPGTGVKAEEIIVKCSPRHKTRRKSSNRPDLWRPLETWRPQRRDDVEPTDRLISFT